MLITKSSTVSLIFSLLFLQFSLLNAEKYSTVRVMLDTKADLIKVEQLGLDLEESHFGENYVDCLIPAADTSRVQALGLKYTVMIDNMQQFYRSRFDPTKSPFSMGGYRTLSEIELVMDSIANAYPSIVQHKYSIGTTIDGNSIYVMKISDNPLVDEDEPEVYYYAATHCREVITPEILIYFMHYLTNNYGTDPQVTYLVDNRELFFTCVVNPDGYRYNEETDPGGGGLWRKNRRNNGNGTWGVDINRNYAYAWGYDNAGSSPSGGDETYRGPSAASEAETQAMQNFIDSRHFVVTISYHSFANMFLYPWGYIHSVTPDNDIFNIMGDSVQSWNGFAVGPPWQLLYPVNGTSDDWGYGEQTLKNKNLAVTLEVGDQSDDFWPPTSRITPLVQENLEPNLFFARMAGNPAKLRAPIQPIIHAIGNVDTSYFQMYWHHSDPDNPAVSFEVEQLQGLTRISDDFESGTGHWNMGGFVSSTTRAHSGTTSVWGGNSNDIDNKITSGQTMQVSAGDSLKFWTWYNIESGWDYGYVQVSTDGGVVWNNLAGNITTTNDPHGQNQGNGITGSSGGNWTQAKFSLSSYVGKEVYIRLRYVTDPATSSGGWYADDITPVEFYASTTQLSNSVTDTTLLVQNLGIGQYAFKVRAKDAQNQYSAYSAGEAANVNYTIFVPCTWLVGDADNSGTVNISDAVYLISYIFSGGTAPAPSPIGSGDADCSNTVNISDAVYLIAYIFAGGPAPGQTCDCNNY